MIKLSRVRVGLNVMIAIIHPIWAMDEYARIFRSWVWLRPPQPPSKMDRIAMIIITGELMEGEIWIMMEIGAIFCHVSRISPDISGIPWVTSGTQK